MGQSLRPVVTLLAAAMVLATVKVNPVNPDRGSGWGGQSPVDLKDLIAKIGTVSKSAHDSLEYYKNNTNPQAFKNSINAPRKLLRLPDAHNADVSTMHQTNSQCLSEAEEKVRRMMSDNDLIIYDSGLLEKAARIESSINVALSRLLVTQTITSPPEAACAVWDEETCRGDEECMIITFRDIQTVADDMMRRYRSVLN